MAVALVALDAVVHVAGTSGERRVALTDLHRLPGDRPDLETTLEPGELITAGELPPAGFAARSAYRKVRDRASYAFALVSVAAGLELDGDTIVSARLALGGVAPKPWRARKAEELLREARPRRPRSSLPRMPSWPARNRSTATLSRWNWLAARS
ncbi:xanthine dehydrogenase YagS FAD-binding subunit [Lentzea jiangxiensis]|uniref:Xanthine dehydrogenase YagS FAD-binding subunit n=1 Tax=Lentzea jiangxiensis TaxID=641025 RepID=A0A1H0SQC3_9PSEU|nr:xanthine dehydrogenase YagS FAD-binding subunit [Lentzea jiangxiensis]